MIMIVMLISGSHGGLILPVRGELLTATFTVNSTDPMTADTNPGDGLCHTTNGDCSLYAAIQESNALNGADTILFNLGTDATIEFDDSACCLIPLSDKSGGTIIQGEEAITLKYVGETPPVYGSIGITIISEFNKIQGLTIQDFDMAIAVPGDYNIIGKDGVNNDDLIEGNLLLNNVIGVGIFGLNNLVAGNILTGSSQDGIMIGENASGNVIGIKDSLAEPAGNQIIGAVNGINVRGINNIIAGNETLNCQEYGIYTHLGTTGNIIGTNGNGQKDASEGNWIGNCQAAGIGMWGSSNFLSGNFIGADPASNLTPNHKGVIIAGDYNRIGSNGDGVSDDLERNYIAGNQSDNISILGNDNLFYKNWIGVLPNGLGTEEDVIGVEVCKGSRNIIGSANSGMGNLIAYNEIGIDITGICGTASANLIRGNSVRDNRDMGINLEIMGINVNDALDGDKGANDLQNHAELSAALLGVNTTVIGSLNSVPGKTYTVDFYASSQCESTHPSGEQYLGTTSTTTNISGYGSFIVDLPQIDAGMFITSLVTNPTKSTSEFSACTRIMGTGTNDIIKINSTADQVDLNPGDGLCDTGDLINDVPECTLRAAIQHANAAADEDLIILPAGIYELTIAGIDEDNAVSGDLDINDDLSIIGAGPAITIIDANGIDRIFDITPQSAAVVSITHITFQEGHSDSYGSAINVAGDLTLLNSSVRWNSTNGDGVLFVQEAGTLQVENLTIYSNTVTGNGGGIYGSGNVEIINSTISGNQANGEGGGLYLAGGSHNLKNVTITGNTADADEDDIGDGGGIFDISNAVNIQNSIIAQNRDLSGSGEQDGNESWDCAGDFISTGYNLITDNTGCSGFDADGDVTGGWDNGNFSVLHANLNQLADNGGVTLTHMPINSENNLVIDQGNPAVPASLEAACQNLDQRGIPRPVDGNGDGERRCDKGAVEFNLPVISVISPAVTEGDPAEFVIKLQPSSPVTVTVQYKTTGVSAIPNLDFYPITGTLVFTPSVTAKSLTVQTIHDQSIEGDESFNLELFNVDNATLVFPISEGLIIDANALPNLSILDVSVWEATNYNTEATFKVSLTFSNTMDAKVWFSTASGTAKPDDYIPLAGWLTIPAYSTQESIKVQIIGDAIHEEYEIFSVNLSDPIDIRIADPRGICTIKDDDTYNGYNFLPLMTK